MILVGGKRGFLPLRTHAAEVHDDFVIAVSAGIPGMAPIVEFADGSAVEFSWDELIRQAVDFKKEEEGHQ